MKLPLREPEEHALRVEMADWDGYVSSALLSVEAIRACARHKTEYGKDARDWLVGVSLVPLDDLLLDAAAALRPAGLRSLDALHLATALSVRDEIGVFLTYDERLAAAARERDLPVASPS